MSRDLKKFENPIFYSFEHYFKLIREKRPSIYISDAMRTVPSLQEKIWIIFKLYSSFRMLRCLLDDITWCLWFSFGFICCKVMENLGLFKISCLNITKHGQKVNNFAHDFRRIWSLHPWRCRVNELGLISLNRSTVICYLYFEERTGPRILGPGPRE